MLAFASVSSLCVGTCHITGQNPNSPQLEGRAKQRTAPCWTLPSSLFHAVKIRPKSAEQGTSQAQWVACFHGSILYQSRHFTRYHLFGSRRRQECVESLVGGSPVNTLGLCPLLAVCIPAVALFPGCRYNYGWVRLSYIGHFHLEKNQHFQMVKWDRTSYQMVFHGTKTRKHPFIRPTLDSVSCQKRGSVNLLGSYVGCVCWCGKHLGAAGIQVLTEDQTILFALVHCDFEPCALSVALVQWQHQNKNSFAGWALGFGPCVVCSCLHFCLVDRISFRAQYWEEGHERKNMLQEKSHPLVRLREIAIDFPAAFGSVKSCELKHNVTGE